MSAAYQIEADRRQRAEDEHFKLGCNGGKRYGQMRIERVLVPVNHAEIVARFRGLGQRVIMRDQNLFERLLEESSKEQLPCQVSLIIVSCCNQISRSDVSRLCKTNFLMDAALTPYLGFLLRCEEAHGISWARPCFAASVDHPLADVEGRWDFNKIGTDPLPDLCLGSHHGQTYAGSYHRLVFEPN